MFSSYIDAKEILDGKSAKRYMDEYGGCFNFHISRNCELYKNSKSKRKESDAVKKYFNDGEGYLGVVRGILKDFDMDTEKVGTFLDFASGYGKFTRFLVCFLDRKKITVSDISKDAVDFNIEEFGVKGFYSAQKAGSIECKNKFDVINVISLFTHLSYENWADWQKKLLQMLNVGGYLIFTTHGVGLAKTQAKSEKVVKGFYYLEKNETCGRLSEKYYGTTYVSCDFVVNFFKDVPGCKLMKYYEKGLGYQDIYVIKRN